MRIVTPGGNWERRGVSWEDQESRQVLVFTSLYLLLQSYFHLLFRKNDADREVFKHKCP